MGEDYILEISRFKQFLEEFCTQDNGPVGKDDLLPFRLVTFRLTEEEIEGECSSWVVEYLQNLNHAPALLVAAIVQETLRIVKDADLTPYVKEKGGEEEEHTCKEINANGFVRFVLTQVHEICTKWREKLPDLKLPSRIPQISVQAIRNNRRKMEDKHVVIPDMHTFFGGEVSADKPRSFYAVYDGHGGVDASYYAAAHLHYLALKEPDIYEDPSSALIRAFRRTDEAFIAKAEREGLRSGSTGVVAIVDPDAIHVSWLGDSQVLLVRDGQPVILMQPHSPERVDEKKRIEQMGGCVVWFGAWRVNGSLSVSRSIGDPEYKPYVSNEADAISVPRLGNEECLILACDGLWDGVSYEEACKLVTEHIASGGDKSDIAAKLVNLSKENGSGDNISVVVVFLDVTLTNQVAESVRKKEKLVDTEEREKGEEMDVNGEVTDEKEKTKESEERTIVGTKDADGSTQVPSHLEKDIHEKQSDVSTDGASDISRLGSLLKSISVSNDVPTEKSEIIMQKNVPRFSSKSQLSYTSSSSSHRKSSKRPIDKDGKRVVTRSKSEPPSMMKKEHSKAKDSKEILVELEIVPRSKKTIKKGVPMKHNSLPSTLKTRRSNSLTRKQNVAEIIKTKENWKRRTFPKQNKGD